jgi:hypothetical protein
MFIALKKGISLIAPGKQFLGNIHLPRMWVD